MSFLFFGKKKKEESCCCSAGSGSSVERKKSNSEHCVMVLGSGCVSCKTMYENVKAVLGNSKLDIDVEYITDMNIIAAYGIMSMPALIVDDKVVSSGKVLKPKEIEKLLQLDNNGGEK